MTITRIITRIMFVIAVAVPVILHAQSSQYITTLGTSSTPTSFTANYQFNGNFNQPVSLYAWVGESDQPYSTWQRNLFLTQINATTPNPSFFSAEFNYGPLGLVAGKTYGYVISDKMVETSSALFPVSDPSIKRCFTVTNGAVACPSEAFEPLTPLPAGPVSNNPGGTQNQQGSQNPNPNAPGAAPENSTELGQVSIVFPPEQQVITDTSAEIHGIVTTLLTMPINLTVLSTPLGGLLGNEQPLLTAGSVPSSVYYGPGGGPMGQGSNTSANLQAGETRTFVINFNGLTPGTTYQFAIRNTVTNTISDTLQFTTTGGSAPGGVITYSGGLFPYTPNAQNTIPGASSDIGTYPDTISDKGIIPRCGRSEGTPQEMQMCTFQDFLQMIANAFQYAIIIMGLVIGAMVVGVGMMIMFYAGKKDPTAEAEKKVKQYAELLWRIFIGVFVITVAWTVVATILLELKVKPMYILLDLFN